MMNEITIFYSWQSDLPDNTNRKIIREAIHLAIPDIEENNVQIVLDEATRGEPGSPYIPGAIIDKIKLADIFIGDVTTTNQSCSCGAKKTPNPNVVFELGFAVAHLGWKRIILLVNTHYTDISKDLPFDFDRHRATPFKVNVNNKTSIKQSREELRNTVETCVQLILKENPVKEWEKKNLSPDEIKRNRDLVNIKWIMETIHQPSLQEHAKSGPRYLEQKILHFWESFNGVFTNQLFHLYDSDLYKKFEMLHEAWEISVSAGEHYHSANNPNIFVFANPMDMPLNKRQKIAWDKIDEALAVINKMLSEINEAIRNNYLELDIDELNRKAWHEYVSFQREFLEELEKNPHNQRINADGKKRGGADAASPGARWLCEALAARHQSIRGNYYDYDKADGLSRNQP